MTRFASNFGLNRLAAGLGLATTAAILAAGCSSQASPTTTTKAPTTTTTSPGTTSTTTTTIGGGSSSALALLGKFKSGEHATFVASYKITSGAQSLTTLTLAQQPPNQLLKAVTSSESFELITIGAKSYICSGQDSAGNGGTCLSEAKSNPDAVLFAIYEPSKYLPYFEAAAQAAGAKATISSKSVNGISLQCISVSGIPGQSGSGTYCVTAQGVLGYASWTGATAADSGSFEISSYSTSVPSNEFTLPATPTTIP